MTTPNKPSKHTIVQPTIIHFSEQTTKFIIEYSVHKCPILLKSDMKSIFPSEKELFDKEQLYIIPTFQPVPCSLFVFDEESDRQKDVKLHNVSTISMIVILNFIVL